MIDHSSIWVLVALIVLVGLAKTIGDRLRRTGIFGRAQRASSLFEAAERAIFQRKRLMNRGEFRVFSVIEKVVGGRGFRAMAQTSLGELLTTPDANAFAAINAKRADLVVIDREGYAVAVVEVQGSGHRLSSDTDWRDRTKRAALESAGVVVIEVTGRESETELQSRFATI